MFSKRGLDYPAGALLIALVAAVVVSLATNPISSETFREDATGVLADIVEDRDLFIVSTGFDLASNFIGIALAAVIYLVFRSHDRTLALLGSFGFLAGSVAFLVFDMASISLISLAQEYAAATGLQADSILNSSRAIGLMLDAAFAMAAVGLALGFLSYGLLCLTTNAVPGWMGLFGMAGGIVAPFGWLLFVDADLVAIGFVELMIGVFFALILGMWLVARGASEAT